MDLAKFYKDKKVLVTGHTGFKGAWLSEILLHFGAEVCGYSLEPNTTPNLFTVLGLEKNVDHNIGDIRKIEALNEVVQRFKPDILFHLAAQPIVRDSYDDPIYTYETNVIGTANVLESIRMNKIKAGVIITTDKVYKNIEQDIAYKEDDALGGHDPYSNSKACADLLVTSYIKSFFDPKDHGSKHTTAVASARAGNVIGGGDWAKDRLIPDAMRAFLLDNVDLTIRKPNAIRPWQHVFEPLHGYLLLGQKLFDGDITTIGSWNFGPLDDDMQSVENVLGLVVAHLAKGKYIVQEDDSKHEATNLKLDSSKAIRLLGWKPRMNLKQAVEATCDWYAEFYSRPKSVKALSDKQIEDYFREKK